MSNSELELKTYRMVDEVMRICRSAIHKAQAKSRRLGVPNVYFINGHRYYEMPNGDFTRVSPYKSKSNGESTEC
jgi:hypothetical protein